MGPHLAIRVFVFVKSLILGLDIYKLSDLIIFMTITNISKEKKIIKKSQTHSVSVLFQTRARLRPISVHQDLPLFI